MAKPRINPAQCLRMRFEGSGCNRCVEVCPRGAIEIVAGPSVSARLCSECMLCAAACSTSAIEMAGSEWHALMTKLGTIPGPVLGCGKSEVRAHARSECLGFLSEEHLLAMSVCLGGGVTLNLSECGGCENGFITERLKTALANVESLPGPPLRGRVRLVEERDELEYEDATYDRRAFWRGVRQAAGEAAVELRKGLEHEEIRMPYHEKTVPVRMEVLNGTLRALSGNGDGELLRRSIVERYYFEATRDEKCELCFGCVGACPTGALEMRDGGEVDESGPTGETAFGDMLFDASLCTGCGLCREFCLRHSISIRRGLERESPFGCKPVSVAGCPGEEAQGARAVR